MSAIARRGTSLVSAGLQFSEDLHQLQARVYPTPHGRSRYPSKHIKPRLRSNKPGHNDLSRGTFRVQAGILNRLGRDVSSAVKTLRGVRVLGACQPFIFFAASLLGSLPYRGEKTCV